MLNRLQIFGLMFLSSELLPAVKTDDEGTGRPGGAVLHTVAS